MQSAISVIYLNIEKERGWGFTGKSNRWYKGSPIYEVRNWPRKNNQDSQGGIPNGLGAWRFTPLVSKAAEKFSFPTLTNSRPFGNTKQHFYRVASILPPLLDPPARYVTILIAIAKSPLTFVMPSIFFHNWKRKRYRLRGFYAEKSDEPFLCCRSSWFLIFSIRCMRLWRHCYWAFCFGKKGDAAFMAPAFVWIRTAW